MIALQCSRARSSACRHDVGNDFPHQSARVDSKKLLDEHFSDQPKSVRDAIVAGNVRDLYGF